MESLRCGEVACADGSRQKRCGHPDRFLTCDQEGKVLSHSEKLIAARGRQAEEQMVRS